MDNAKRINLIKITSETYNRLLDSKVIVDDDFLLSIFNKCEYYENRNIETIPYAVMVTDEYRVMALILDMNGKITKYSSLLLDEEEDVLDISRRLGILKINYKVIDKKESNDTLTRYENHILKYIRNDINNCYKEKDISKLKYLYYEYFNKNGYNFEEMYQKLIKELSNVNEKHRNLYDLIKLSYSHKNV